MDRRSFLMAATALILANGLTGCTQRRDRSATIQLLQGSVPPQLLREFQQRLPQARAIDFSASKQLADLFSLLQAWQAQTVGAESGNGRSPAPRRPAAEPIADLVSLGDYWLTPAIQQGLIRPLSLDGVEGWASLAAQPIWQSLLQRNERGAPDPQGSVWAAPYRWGTLAIAYHQAAFRDRNWSPPTDWQDLWRPEFRGYLSLPNSPRLVIGLILKKLMQSVNSDPLTVVSTLEEDLQTLHRQVKFYSSEDYLQPLVLGDTYLAVGWSTEILPTAQRDHRLATVLPTSGTILTADLWVQPASAAASSTTEWLQQWLSFFWEPAIATQLSLLSDAASPIFLTDSTERPATLADQSLLLPPADRLAKSEFLLPLPEATMANYRRLWVEVRQSSSLL